MEEVSCRMDQAYTDKLEGKIPEDFWQRKMIEWQAEEEKINIALAGLRICDNDGIANAKRICRVGRWRGPGLLG
jgi:hypothetical protein